MAASGGKDGEGSEVDGAKELGTSGGVVKVSAIVSEVFVFAAAVSFLGHFPSNQDHELSVPLGLELKVIAEE